MKRKNFIFVFAAVMALGFMSCNNDGKDIVVKETDYTEVFLNAFEEKLSLVFHTAERDLRRGNHDFELLFKNAYVEVLGNYADVSTFENAFLEMSDKTHAVRTRSSIEETVFMNLTYRVIDSSETKKEAIEKFDALAKDASLDLEDRVGFISMREFLVFLDKNAESILADIEDFDDFENEDGVSIRRWSWGSHHLKCALGTFGIALTTTATLCLASAGVGFLVGNVPGAIVGCAVGGVVGNVAGTATGAATFCF